MSDLIKESEDCIRYLKHNSSQIAQSEYFGKGSVVVFESVTEKTLSEHCADALNAEHGIILTLKENCKGAASDWKRFEKDTALFALTKCTLQCIPHSNRKEFAKTKDLSGFQTFEVDIPTGHGVLLAYSMPWILKEGSAKAFVISVKKPTTTINSTSSKNTNSVSTYADCVAKHNELKSRIAKLDQRVWSEQGPNEKKIQQCESTLNEESDKASIKKYAKSLTTLEGRVVAAEKDTSLPGLLKTLEEIGALLRDSSKLSHINAKTRTHLQKEYNVFVGTKLNLVGKAKGINDLIGKIKECALKGVTTKSGPKTLLVPQIEEDVLTPYVIDRADGPDGYRCVIKSFVDDGSKFATMVQALKHPELTALYDKWVAQRGQVGVQVQLANRDPSQTVDVTLFVAYGEALRSVYEETKNANNPTNTPTTSGGSGAAAAPITKVTPKTIKCEECEGRKRPFDNTNLCKECWIEHTLKPRIEKLEDRADCLSRKVKKEQKEREEREGDDEEDVLDPRGPLEKAYDEYVELNEELEAAYVALEKPNSSAPAWEKLKGFIEQAEALLPHVPGEREEDDENYDSADVDDIVEYSDESSSTTPKKNKRTHSEDEEEEEEDEEESLSHKTILTLHRIPVQNVHKKLVNDYVQGRYKLVEEEIKALEDVQEIYSFTVQQVDPDEGDEGEPEEWHTCYLNRADAAKQANDMRIPGKVKTKVVTKRVRPTTEEEETKKSKPKIEEDDEEEEEEN
jgi:hypothetical protein